jgi:hypothetical protein
LKTKKEENKKMKVQMKMSGRVINVKASTDKVGKSVTYVTLGYMGGAVQVVYRGVTAPIIDTDVDADVEAELVSATIYGRVSVVALPRALIAFKVVK